MGVLTMFIQLLCLGQSVAKMVAVNHGLGKTINEINPAELMSVRKASGEAASRDRLTDNDFRVTMQATCYLCGDCISPKSQPSSYFSG